MAERKINLQAEMDASDGGLIFEVGKRATVDYAKGEIKMHWCITVSRRRLTSAGRAGKPAHITSFIGSDNATPATLLRDAATIYEHGDVPMVDGRET